MKIIETKQEYLDILAANKSVFVDFYADWCGPCKMVGPLVEQLSEKETDVVFLKVNVDKTPDVAAMYGVMSIPTLIAIKDGEVAAQGVGYQPLPQLEKLVEKAK